MHRPGRGGNSGRYADEIITTGATPMLRAAASQDSEAVRLLLDHGGRIDVPNVMGVTPLMAAAGWAWNQPPLRSQRQRCAGSVDRDARNPVGGRRRRERADHRRHEPEPRAWDVAARCRSRAGRARYSARCNGPGPRGPVSDRSRRASASRTTAACHRSTGYGAEGYQGQSALPCGRQDTPDGTRPVDVVLREVQASADDRRVIYRSIVSGNRARHHKSVLSHVKRCYLAGNPFSLKRIGRR